MASNNLIKQLQKTELDILSEALNICKKLNLRVFAVSGTCLGAVKYGGFIPWDDDVDIALPRKDYEIFIKEAQKLLPPHYFLQTHETDPEYRTHFAKIRDSRTTFLETNAYKLNINHGVYIDIFPLDGYPEGKLNQKLFMLKKRWYTLRISRIFYSPKRSLKWKLASAFAVLLMPSLEKTWKKQDALYRKLDFDSAKLVGNFGNAWGKKEIVPKHYFDSSTAMPFENIELLVPGGYEEYLKKLYGDITKDPPESEQVPHHFALVIDLNKSYIDNRDVIKAAVCKELKK